PDVDIQHQSNGPRGRKAAGFKEKDRAKGKHAHERPSRGGVDAPTSGFDPRTIIKRLDWLAQTEDVGSIWLQPLNKSERQIVHILAREYHVKSKSHGNGARRTPVLTQKPSSCKPTNSRRIRRVLMLYDEGGLIPEQWSGPSVPSGSSRYNGSKAQRGGKGKQGRGRGGNGGGSAQAPLPDGKIVAENAPEVGASNIGHKMLQQMGWQPGQGLGVKEEGRATPVDVMIRAGRRGLGA
ncbi:squalene synthetase-like protein, partial [Coemansia sp. RSA 2320]